ncbi:MAG: class I SAM-dependent methyltransferase [Candidatus Margulisiibacteriota bacterium]
MNLLAKEDQLVKNAALHLEKSENKLVIDAYNELLKFYAEMIKQNEGNFDKLHRFFYKIGQVQEELGHRYQRMEGEGSLRQKEHFSEAVRAYLDALKMSQHCEGLSQARRAEYHLRLGALFYLHNLGNPEKHFKLAMELSQESVFYLVGLISVKKESSRMSEYILKEASAFSSDIHEDGSMETPIPYLKNVVETTDFIYALPAKGIYRLLRDKYGLEGGKILDVGTGPGPFALALAKNLPASFRMIAYDVSEKMLALARGRADGLRIKMDFSLGPIIDPGAPLGEKNALPFEDGSIDFIVSHGSMHHWGGGNSNPAAVAMMLKELHRILKPGGGMLIYDINPRGILTKLMVRFHLLRKLGGEYQDKAFAHSVEHSFKREEIVQLAKQCGFNEYQVYFAKPLFPIGLSFHVLEVKKKNERIG